MAATLRFSVYWLLCLPVLLGCLCLASPFNAQAEIRQPQKILVINAYHRGFKWTDSITSGLESVFESGPQKIQRQVQYIYLDTKRIYTPEYLQKLRDIYQLKFGSETFDVIIAADNNALSFVVENRDDIFGPVPVVFCGINDFQPDLLHGAKGYTGVNELPDFQGNIELIMRLQPKVREIVVIEDDTVTGHRTNEQLKRIIPEYKGRLRFRLLAKPTQAELQETLASLSDNSAVLYTTFFRDGNGQFIEYDESANMVATASRVPVYATWDFSLGYGVVGGKLTDGFSQGEAAARVALRILDGTPVNEIPIRMTSPSRYMFDAKVLKRFNIPFNRVPEQSIIINKPDERYTSLLLRSSLIILLLLAGLTILAVINYRRKKAEKAMRLGEERLRAIFANGAVGIGITDTRGRYLQMNETWRLMLGLPKEWHQRQPTISSETPDAEHFHSKETFRQLVTGGTKTFRQERKFCRADKSTFWGDHTISPIHDDDGKVVAMVNLTVDVTERRHAEEEIRRLAYFDSLTRLPNRTLFLDRLSQALRWCKREKTVGALLFLDIDEFKEVNDTFGHSGGDQLLQTVGQKLKASVRATDTVARLGGDEFVVLLPQVQNQQDVAMRAKAILETLRTPLAVNGQKLVSSSSMGIALFPADGNAAEHLIKKADQAMYVAKKRGGDSYAFFSEASP